RCVSVLMPGYNEARTVAQAIACVIEQPCVKEIIITDDASTDGSWELVKKIAELDPCVTALRHPANRGKGAAIRTAFEKAIAPIILFQDADGEYDPSDYTSLVGPIVNGKA